MTKVILIFLGIMAIAQLANSMCCSCSGFGAMGGCCATRSCNIFCCNCDGTCRSGGWRRKRSPEEMIENVYNGGRIMRGNIGHRQHIFKEKKLNGAAL